MLIGKIANSVIFIPVLCSNAATGVIWRELLNGKIPAVETFFGLFGIKASMLLGNAKTCAGGCCSSGHLENVRDIM